MVKHYTSIGIDKNTKAKWEFLKELKYGDMAECVTQDKMLRDLLDEQLAEHQKTYNPVGPMCRCDERESDE